MIATGYASVFYREGDAGTERLLEDGGVRRMMPGAFDRSRREGFPFVTCTFGHDDRFQLGWTVDGTLLLEVDSKGLAFRLTLPDTVVGDHIAHLIRVGRVRGCSTGWTQRGARQFRENGREVTEVYDLDLDHITLTHQPAYTSTALAIVGLHRHLRPGELPMIALVNPRPDVEGELL